jgi:hypothetical protein
MAADSSERFVLLNRLAEEFVERYRRGERPSLKEYADRHPELADDIREFFPALAEMKQVKEDRRDVRTPVEVGPLPPLQRLGDFRIIREWRKLNRPADRIFQAEALALLSVALHRQGKADEAEAARREADDILRRRSRDPGSVSGRVRELLAGRVPPWGG